jgi:hypothetical protein
MHLPSPLFFSQWLHIIKTKVKISRVGLKGFCSEMPQILI